ncbi:threonine aldolase family protein [Macrococcoides caseolyticum]|uniref:threonine aldolase family protein n=1 Tax=Macrococcoides caseolyticum TaxID=69966 RepID=UPI001F1A815E|nr:low specificity L-threonine aldolase [Macrococcus caseolyticus]MCE4957348.1 low specificity L-threonine aldolase [Macrococcus caseolyticus]
MIRFDNDYSTGGHPLILERLIATNDAQHPGYGVDDHCKRAAELIKEECVGDVDVHFLVGGTQTNKTVIASMLRPHQAVIAADSGHIAVHETGAIEATGHKVITIPGIEGKLRLEDVTTYVEDYWNDVTFEHMPQPKMVYISQPTEFGTLYSKQELKDLYQFCQDKNMYLMVDGARLGYALAAKDNDVTIKDLSEYSDVFYIGGTKVGALFGEAVVIANDNLKSDFRYFIKQNGGMLAKGRLLGIQFEVLFENNLYEEISKHAVMLADKLTKAFEAKGIQMKYPSPTNQRFPILTKEQIEVLREKYTFADWEKVDDNHFAVRFCTSWSTKVEDVEALIQDINIL